MEAQTPFPLVERDLGALSHATNYNDWLYALCKPHIGSRILEIGAGIGNYTKHWLKHGEVYATDCEDYYVNCLRDTFRHAAVNVGKLSLDCWQEDARRDIAAFQPDTVVCLNVLEHIEDDVAAVRAMLACLSPGGKLILIVPALNWLYSQIDVSYGHHRRYSRHRIELIRGETHSVILRCKYFNSIGALGWLWSHRLLARASLSPSQIRSFDRVVPMLAKVEQRIPPPFGLSIVAVLARSERV